jgi:hypothetical protein
MATFPAHPEAELDGSLPLPASLLRELVYALRTIRFGSVELVIHEGNVVQLERRYKVLVDFDVTRRR